MLGVISIVVMQALFTQAVQVDFSIFGPHYPQSQNASLTNAINGTGAPGTYNSSISPAGTYGTYNWCSMPHVRATEYVDPSSQGYTLLYVELIHRHHKRTPYASNTFFKEDISWDCSRYGPYHFSRNASGQGNQVTEISWQAVRKQANPFAMATGPGFINSTCQLPQLTADSIVDAQVHGSDLASVYRDKLGFLPKSVSSPEVAFRVTNNVITSQTLGGILAGLFPDGANGQLAALIEPSSYDSLEPAISCPLASQIRTNYTGTNPAWQAHLSASSALYAKLDNVSGTSNPDTGGWHTSLDHYYDNLSAKQCHQKSLPCSTNNSAICVTQSEANQVYRLGNYEYSYYFRDAINSTAYSSLQYGSWMLELKSHIQQRLAGQNPVKYFHNVGHDGGVAPLLGFLQIDGMVWPGMGSEVVFEVWAKGGKNYIRVLFSGKPLKSSVPQFGVMDMIDLQVFYDYIDRYVPKNLVATCSMSP